MTIYIQQYKCFTCQVILTVETEELIKLLWALEEHLREKHLYYPSTIKDLFDNYSEPITISST